MERIGVLTDQDPEGQRAAEEARRKMLRLYEEGGGFMLEKPNIKDEMIAAGLRAAYGIEVERITFLPLGVDVNAAVYRVVARGGGAFFLKLRRGAFDELPVIVPQFLKAQGIEAVLAPLETKERQGWAPLGEWKAILYPFVEGQNGFQAALLEAQWRTFGAALKRVHTAQLPPELRQGIPREEYSPRGREALRQFQAQVETETFADPAAAKLARLMQARRSEIDALRERAGALAAALQERPREFVLCHTDIHAGNLLLGEDGSLHIVDWDAPLLAPKERDLMFIGGGIAGRWTGAREVELFYQGYGPAEIDRTALACYRCERIVQDMFEFCQQLLATDEGGEDREQAVEYFASNFRPGHELEMAWRTIE